MENYTIKKENKIETYLVRNKQERYNYKISKYNANKDKRLLNSRKSWSDNRIYVSGLFLPEIRSYKPRADKGIKTDIIFKPTKAFEEAKKAIQSIKIRVKNGNFYNYRHPKLNEIKFEERKMKQVEILTHSQRKESKILKYNSMRFSDLHNKLVAKLYINPFSDSVRMKQRAKQDAHNLKIKNLAKKLQQQRLSKFRYRLDTICNTTEKGLYCAYSNYSNLLENAVKDMTDRLAKKFAATLTNFSHLKVVNNSDNSLVHISTGDIPNDKECMLNKMKLDRLQLEYPNYYKKAV